MKPPTIIILALVYLSIMMCGEPLFGATFMGKTAHDPRTETISETK
jgi:hypothetical protein